MPVFQTLIDFDDMFHKLSVEPIIINNLRNINEADRDKIEDLLTSRYDSSDMITLLPSCRCGHTKGEYALGSKCDLCKTIVKSQIEDEIESSVWFKKPNNIKALLSPIVWIMLDQRFKKSGFSVLQWLTDTTYKTNVRYPNVINEIMNAGIQRGYNNFVENFDIIYNYLIRLKDYALKKGDIDYLSILLEQNKDKIFSNYIPLPNKSLLIIEKTNVGIYVDPIIINAIDAINMLISIDRDFYDQTQRTVENRTAKALAKLSNFYLTFFNVNLSPKTGQFRRHIFGTRTNFSCRAVISSITDTHKYDEIYLPWGIGLSMLRPHLINKLFKLGYDLNSAISLLWGHIEKYNPLLDSLLQELINESKDKGLYVILQRNPSLLQGSAQRVKVTKFKTDPNDHTISMSILITKAPNADFDGDALNIMYSLDNNISNLWYALEPKFNIYQLNKPLEISGNISLPKPVIASISNYLSK